MHAAKKNLRFPVGVIYQEGVNQSLWRWIRFSCSASSVSGSLKGLLNYKQGQSPERKIREYFYYIDHHGQLFLDDCKMKNFTSCFKDKKFLEFFFQRLGPNDSGRYQEHFPFLSLCGRERNFVRCEDLPIVYTELLMGTDGASEYLSFCNGGNLLSTVFQPSSLKMNPENGRVYYPADQKFGGIGLVKSSLALEFSELFEFGNGQNNPPTAIRWRGKFWVLSDPV